MKFLFVGPDVCRRLPSDSTSRGTPLPWAIAFPLLGWLRDLHPLDNAHAERTKVRRPPLQAIASYSLLKSPNLIVAKVILFYLSTVGSWNHSDSFASAAATTSGCVQPAIADTARAIMPLSSKRPPGSRSGIASAGAIK